MPLSVERLPGPEHIADGRFDEIAGRLFLKETLLRQGRTQEAANIRAVVYFQGGGQAVAEEIGFAQYMHEQGWFANGVIDVVIGGSGGAIVAAYGVTGNKEGTRILQANCEKGLASFHNFLRNGRPVDFKSYRETLSEIPPDFKRLREVSAAVLILTNPVAQKREAVDIRTLGDEEILQILYASCLIPGVGNQAHVVINGVKHNDGDLGGVPHKDIDEQQPTEVIVIGSAPMGKTPRERIVGEWMGRVGRRIKDPAIQMALASPIHSEEAMTEMWMRHWREDPDHPVNYAYIGPAQPVLSVFTQDWKLIQERIECSYASAQRLFGRRSVPEDISPDVLIA